MKKLLGLTSAFVLVCAFASAQDVGYNFDQQADFTKYKTYKWVAGQGREDGRTNSSPSKSPTPSTGSSRPRG